MSKIIVDEEDKYLLHSYGFCISKNGYAVARVKQKNEYLHRIIMCAKNKEYVDHINGNKLDNRKENLRVCTNSQNLMNVGTRSNNTSGFRGVHYYKRTGKYQVNIKVNYKRINLGTYNTLEEAIKVRKNAEIKYFGEFRRK